MKALGNRIGTALFRFGASLARSRLRRELMLVDERRLITNTGMTRQMLVDSVRIRLAETNRFADPPAGNDEFPLELRAA